MPSPNYVRLLVRSWRTMIVGALLGAVLASLFSITQPLRYSSTERVLITQTNTAGVDPYTAIKSTERIAQNLSAIMYTTSFFNAVMAKAKVDPSYFPADEYEKRAMWTKTITTSVEGNTGVMTIVAYHPKREEATELAIRVAEEIRDIAPTYFGFSIRVQIIDDPLPSRFIAKPDFAANAGFGAILGCLLGVAWVMGKVKQVG